VSSLLSALSIEDETAQIVPLLQLGSRHVATIDGVFGAKARELVVPKTGRHGSRARTSLLEDQAITLTWHLLGDTDDEVWTEYFRISGSLLSALDTERRLLWTLGTSLRLQSRVRLVEVGGPLEAGPRMLTVQAHFRAPDPRAYAQTMTEVVGSPWSAGAAGGKRYPRVYAYRFRPSTSGAVAFTNRGTAPTPPTITLTGFLLDPIVTLGDRQLVFAGTIAAGDTLTVTNADRPEVLLNGTANRINMLVTERSRWFDLPRGTSQVTLVARDFGTGARIAVKARDAYK
jgi:hypothetical protein